MVEQQRVRGKRERDAREPEPGERTGGDLLARDVDRPEHRHRRTPPEHVLADNGDERPHDEDAETGDEGAEQVQPLASHRRPQHGREQQRRDRRGRGEAVGEQRGSGQRSQQERGGDGRESHPTTSPASSNRAV